MITPRPVYDLELQKLHDKGEKQAHQEMLRQRARDLRWSRMVHGFLFLLTKAEINITNAEYGEFDKHIRVTVPHERNRILDMIVDFCLDNNLPVLPILVGSVGKGPGMGLYTYLRKRGVVIPVGQEEAYRVIEVAKCLAMPIPEPDEYMPDLLKFMTKRRKAQVA